MNEQLRPDRVPAHLVVAPECERHPHARHWRSKLGTVLCLECRQPLDEHAVVEWFEPVAVAAERVR